MRSKIIILIIIATINFFIYYVRYQLQRKRVRKLHNDLQTKYFIVGLKPKNSAGTINYYISEEAKLENGTIVYIKDHAGSDVLYTLESSGYYYGHNSPCPIEKIIGKSKIEIIDYYKEKQEIEESIKK